MDILLINLNSGFPKQKIKRNLFQRELLIRICIRCKGTIKVP